MATETGYLTEDADAVSVMIYQCPAQVRRCVSRRMTSS